MQTDGPSGRPTNGWSHVLATPAVRLRIRFAVIRLIMRAAGESRHHPNAPSAPISLAHPSYGMDHVVDVVIAHVRIDRQRAGPLKDAAGLREILRPVPPALA